MNKKNFLLLIFSIFFSFFLLEILVRFFAVDEEINIKYHYLKYNKAELDKNLPFRKTTHGGECVKRRFIKSMQWHSRIGWNDANVNLKCINNLFSNSKLKIIFMGGSGMANYETPNYKTSIENYIESNISKDFVSINLAEGGGRMSNNLSSFIEYIPKIKNKPDFIIFLDGFNEFTPIIYGGKPDEDFYFTTTVSKRIHDPINYLFLKSVEQSKLLKIIFYKILKIDNNRISKESLSEDLIKLSAREYVYRKEVTEKLCDIYNIKCLFFLQPVFHLSKNLNGKFDYKLKVYEKKFFSSSKKVFSLGYSEIQKLTKVFNLQDIFDGKNEIYTDMVHFNKEGSEIIGKSISKVLLNQIQFVTK